MEALGSIQQQKGVVSPHDVSLSCPVTGVQFTLPMVAAMMEAQLQHVLDQERAAQLLVNTMQATRNVLSMLVHSADCSLL